MLQLVEWNAYNSYTYTKRIRYWIRDPKFEIEICENSLIFFDDKV